MRITIGSFRSHGRRGRLFAALAVAACAGAWSTDALGLLDLIGADGSDVQGVVSRVKELPSNASETVRYVKRKLGGPRKNFQSGMDGMINVARDYNPSAVYHPSYNNIYESMDYNTFLDMVKDGDI